MLFTHAPSLSLRARAFWIMCQYQFTLIIVGAVLGGIVGWGQYWWDARSKRLAAAVGSPPLGTEGGDGDAGI